MLWKRIIAVCIILAGIAMGYAIYATETPGGPFAFTLGLDLNGGTRLVYEAKTSAVAKEDAGDALSVLREVVERRVNLFGVSEPIVRLEQSFDRSSDRLIVELPDVTDPAEAVRLIGQTPLLEFRLLAKDLPESQEEIAALPPEEVFVPTGLTGKYVKHAQVVFNNTQTNISNEPSVLIEFNDEGKKLFATLTRENVGRILAIFLDSAPISTPVIKEEISDGIAQISGSFTPVEARDLAKSLNYGALPLPITLLSTEKVGPTLGQGTLQAGIRAGVVGLCLVIAFLLLWYRLPGLVAAVALLFYGVLTLLLYKLIPVTLTSAGIAGFIISLGMAVDGNILIFERIREELRKGKKIKDALEEGFSRAWFSIRDANISSILTACILFWFGTSVVKGFALTLGLGVFFSILSAVFVTKTLLSALPIKESSTSVKHLFGVRLP